MTQPPARGFAPTAEAHLRSCFLPLRFQDGPLPSSAPLPKVPSPNCTSSSFLAIYPHVRAPLCPRTMLPFLSSPPTSPSGGWRPYPACCGNCAPPLPRPPTKSFSSCSAPPGPPPLGGILLPPSFLSSPRCCRSSASLWPPKRRGGERFASSGRS